MNIWNADKEALLKKRISVEEELNNISYKGVSLGSILSSVYKSNPNYLLPKYSFSYFIKLLFSILSKIRTNKGSNFKDSILFAHYSINEKDWMILNSVYNELYNEKFQIERVQVREIVQVYLFTDLLKWIKFWLFNYRRIYLKLKITYCRNKIKSINYSLVYILLHSLYIESILSRFRDGKPKHVLFTYDRDQYSSILALTCKAIGVKTSTIIHGSSFHLPTGYLPFIADDILVWGRQHISFFYYFGIPIERMKVVGFPQFNNGVGNGMSETSSYLDNNIKNKIVVMLASQPNSNELKIIDLFIHDLLKRVDIITVVKLHPSHSSLKKKDLSKQFPNTIFLDSEISSKEALSMVDVLVGLQSTLLLEGLSLGKPSIIYQPLKELENGVGYLLHKNGGAPYVKDGQLLSSIIPQRKSELNRALNLEKQLSYFNEIVEYRSNESSKMIISYLKMSVEK